MILRYKDIKWTIPFPYDKRKEVFFKTLDNFVTEYIGEDNVFEACFDNIYSPIISDKIMLDNFYSVLPSKYNLQIICINNLEEDLFSDPGFNIYINYLNSLKASLIISDSNFFDFLNEKYKDIKKIAYEDLITIEEGFKNSVDYYETLQNKYDRVILNPIYVKDKFFMEYKSFSDVSKFEIIVNYESYMNSNIKEAYENSFILNKDEIKMLIEEVGIKHFRLNGLNYFPSQIIECLFSYVFYPDAKSIFILNEMYRNNMYKEFYFGD